MRPALAWATVAGLIGAAAAAFLLPPLGAAGLAAASLAAMRRHRAGFVATFALGAAVNAVVLAAILQGPGLAVALPGPGHVALTFSAEGARVGLVASMRLAAALGANLAVLSWLPPERLVDGLRLPAAPTAVVAAVLVTAHDLGRDLDRLRDAARLDGRWPRPWWRRIPATAALLPPLVLLAVRRSRARAEALRLAGLEHAPWTAALVAVTALACAGRMAALAVPNDPLTYAAVFLGGLLFGARIGAAGGLLAMAITNVLISGLHPAAFANAPAMALLGLLGGLVRRLRMAREGRAAASAVAAACGAVGVLLFSLAADALTWLLVPETRAQQAGLLPYVAVGLAFNAVPAAAAAVVFGLAIAPVVRAADAAGLAPAPLAGRSEPPARA